MGKEFTLNRPSLSFMKFNKEFNKTYKRQIRLLFGVLFGDRVENETSLERVQMSSLTNIISHHQLGWFGHKIQVADDEPRMIFALFK